MDSISEGERPAVQGITETGLLCAFEIVCQTFRLLYSLQVISSIIANNYNPLDASLQMKTFIDLIIN